MYTVYCTNFTKSDHHHHHILQFLQRKHIMISRISTWICRSSIFFLYQVLVPEDLWNKWHGTATSQPFLKMWTAPFLSPRNSAGDRQVVADDVLKGDGSSGDDWPDEAVRLSSPTERLCWIVSELLPRVKSCGFFLMYLQATCMQLPSDNWLNQIHWQKSV